MKTLNFVENDDGSATVTLEISEEENSLLIQYAVTNILKEEIIDTEGGLPDKNDKINKLINNIIKKGKVIDKPIVKPPQPPLIRRIKDGDTRKKCSICGSSLKWKFWPFIKDKYCIQPQCKNYYGKILY